MVKPQFEVGRERRRRAAASCARSRRGAGRSPPSAGCARELGAAVLGFAPSGLPGPAGNRETFAWLAEGGRAGAPADVAALLAEVDA